jgi:hypothetical protein
MLIRLDKTIAGQTQNRCAYGLACHAEQAGKGHVIDGIFTLRRE